MLRTTERLRQLDPEKKEDGLEISDILKTVED